MTKKAATPASYVALHQELHDIVMQIQSADVDIDTALGLHERGMALIVQLEDYLKHATNRIEKQQPHDTSVQ